MRQICVAGKNSIAVNAVKYLLEHLLIPEQLISVLTNKNDVGIDSWQPSLKKYAHIRGIKLASLDELYKHDNLLFISLEYDQIIKPQKFKSKDLFNIHFSLLPKYKGMYTSAWPIINGEHYSGVTLHLIDEGIDTGDIIDQISIEIPLSFTSRDLYFKLLDQGSELFKRNIQKLLSGDYSISPQTFLGSYYGKSSIEYKNLKIDLNKTSFEIYNQLRAFIFSEYQFPTLRGYKVKSVRITYEKIHLNHFEVFEKIIILSGIDGFKIICEIDN